MTFYPLFLPEFPSPPPLPQRINVSKVLNIRPMLCEDSVKRIRDLPTIKTLQLMPMMSGRNYSSRIVPECRLLESSDSGQ
jgi:hypothetical protein